MLDLNAIGEAIEVGLEYARQCLTNHDAALGRTTHKNRTWAETIEGEIQQMKNALDLLPVLRELQEDNDRLVKRVAELEKESNEAWVDAHRINTL